jgi:hypothetical protein
LTLLGETNKVSAYFLNIIVTVACLPACDRQLESILTRDFVVSSAYLGHVFSLNARNSDANEEPTITSATSALAVSHSSNFVEYHVHGSPIGLLAFRSKGLVLPRNGLRFRTISALITGILYGPIFPQMIWNAAASSAVNCCFKGKSNPTPRSALRGRLTESEIGHSQNSS